MASGPLAVVTGASVSGKLRDKVQAVAGKPMPETAKAKMHGSQAEPGSNQPR